MRVELKKLKAAKTAGRGNPMGAAESENSNSNESDDSETQAGSEDCSDSNASEDSTTDSEAQSKSSSQPATPRNIELETKLAIPLFVQERLHECWLDGTLVKAQPQGSDELQLDVEKALQRTHTQASINTSVGRADDDQHCFFGGHLLYPNIAIEYDSMSPMGPNRVKCSGQLALKTRIFSLLGLKTGTIHSAFWTRLSDDQKDEQIMRMRVGMGYVHQRSKDEYLNVKGQEKPSDPKAGSGFDIDSTMMSLRGSDELKELAVVHNSRNGNGSSSNNNSLVDLSKPQIPNNDPNRSGAIVKPFDAKLERMGKKHRNQVRKNKVQEKPMQMGG